MAETTLAQIELISQQLSARYKCIEDLMSQAWLEHELARESLRHLCKTYNQWLAKEGIEHEV